jgi:hypothetical protein
VYLGRDPALNCGQLYFREVAMLLFPLGNRSQPISDQQLAPRGGGHPS